MWLVVGLGNPGVRYRHTRHNLGFMVVDRLARRWSITLASGRADVTYGIGAVASVPAVLAQPQTFMNANGTAVAQLARAYGITPPAIVTISDDLDLPLGRIRVRGGGGPGGHRGLASLIAAVGTGFNRVRVGIGRPVPDSDPVTFVLQPFAPDETEQLARSLERAADAVECLLRVGLAPTMNAFNVAPDAR